MEQKIKSILPDKVYDVLKWIAIIALPTASFLYNEVGPLWGWPMVTEVTTTLVKVGVALGMLIGISAIQYESQKRKLENPEDK